MVTLIEVLYFLSVAAVIVGIHLHARTRGED